MIRVTESTAELFVGYCMNNVHFSTEVVHAVLQFDSLLLSDTISIFLVGYIGY